MFGAQAPISVRTAVTCDVCDGVGRGRGTRPVTCYECDGSGQVRRVRQSILGQMVTAGPCPRCGGLGEVIASPCERAGAKGG